MKATACLHRDRTVSHLVSLRSSLNGGKWGWRETPLISLQRHDTAPNEAVNSALAEEKRLFERTKEKERQVTASHRLAQRRVRAYENLKRHIQYQRAVAADEATDVSSIAPSSTRIVSSRDEGTDRRLEEFDDDNVTCAVNSIFIGDNDMTPPDIVSRTAAQSKMAKRRFKFSDTQNKQEIAPQIATADTKVEDDEEELTQVTWTDLPDTQRTEDMTVISEEDGNESIEEIPPLLLTPGRSSNTSTKTVSALICPDSQQRTTMKKARALDLYFYPRLATREITSVDDNVVRRSRQVSCRRQFADVERETTRRNRQREKAEAKARRLKSTAEAKRKRKEALIVEETIQSHPEVKVEDKRLTSAEDSETKGQETSESPKRYSFALKMRIREKCVAAGIEVPALCPCSSSAWDVDPDKCAVNCVFYRNNKGYLRMLMTFLPDNEK